MAVAISKRVGARHVVITDVNDYRLELARKMGATRAVNVTRDKLDDVMKNSACRRVSTWDSRCRAIHGVPRHAPHHAPRRQRRPVGIPPGETASTGTR